MFTGAHKHAWWDLLKLPLHPESPGLDSKLSRRDRFNSWMFLHDLCTYGPDYFHQFKSLIPKPECIEQIPLVKTPIFAARAMDVNNSTVSGNIQAVTDLLAQGGIGDPDVSEYVILIHGDLGTGERLQAAQLRRSIESTSWNRLQHVVFIPGLFHLKMACADVLWRCFVQPLAAREDETSLMRDIAQLRPKETGIYTTKPGFRRMHQLIGHAGICCRLDCWRVHAETKGRFSDLQAFALSKPTLDDLKKMADEIACTYVEFENALLLNKYFLLYEELSYAMNHGDIGCNDKFPIQYAPHLSTGFKVSALALSRHKNALTWSIDRHAIRYHILINPTGHPMKWRAMDWCVELNND